MSDLTKVGPALLEMDDIAAYLNIAKNFATREEIEGAPTAGNGLEKIAGIPSNRVALCIAPADRSTVENALNLGGLPPSAYMMATAGSHISESLKNAQENYNTELSELRDEVYQLREELAKAGIVHSYFPYAGFYDVFRKSNPLHMADSVGIPLKDSVKPNECYVDDLLFDRLSVGEKIVLKSSLGSDLMSIMEIREKDVKGPKLIFTKDAGFPIERDSTVIYRSKGNIINGTFTFGEITERRPGEKEFYTCLDDDTFVAGKKINGKGKGFGYTFRIAAAKQKSYLAGVDIQVQKHGSPGNLICCIMDERDIERFRNPAQAIDDNKMYEPDGKTIRKDFYDTKFFFFAVSQPLSVDGALPMHYETFNFYNGSDYPYLDDIDTYEGKVRLAMVICPADGAVVDEDNYYDIRFLQNMDEDGNLVDLQLNNTTYYYNEQGSHSLSPALTTDRNINATDLFYGITLKNAVDNTFKPYEDGLYTAGFMTYEPVCSTKARLTMRIAREGLFRVTDEGQPYFSGNIRDMGSLSFMDEDTDDKRNSASNGFALSQDEKIVAGSTIFEVDSVKGNGLIIKKGGHVEVNDIAYPMGYEVYLKASLEIWNPETCEMEKIRETRLPMKLSSVMPDIYRPRNDVSDRLVFECPFTSDGDGTLLPYNRYELQIYWQKTSRDIGEKLAGRIFDLVLSLDRSL